MTDIHERKCWTCGHIGEHQDRIVPWVLCPECGSQDTRATKKPVYRPSTQEVAEKLDALLQYLNRARDMHGVLDEVRDSLQFKDAERSIVAYNS